MTATLDARPHAAAIKVALKAALNSVHAYDYDEVPGSAQNANAEERRKPLPNIFAVISVELIPSSNQRLTGQSAVRRWIVSVRSLGRTIDEARWAMAKTTSALYEKRLTVEGVTTSPIQSQPGQAPEWDDGRFVGLMVFTYSH